MLLLLLLFLGVLLIKVFRVCVCGGAVARALEVSVLVWFKIVLISFMTRASFYFNARFPT